MSRYELTLFVSGASRRSSRAIADATRVCDVHLRGEYRLSVIDVNEDLTADPDRRLLAVPTLVKNLPLPVCRIVGDMSNATKVLLALNLPAIAVACELG